MRCIGRAIIAPSLGALYAGPKGRTKSDRLLGCDRAIAQANADEGTARLAWPGCYSTTPHRRIDTTDPLQYASKPVMRVGSIFTASDYYGLEFA